MQILLNNLADPHETEACQFQALAQGVSIAHDRMDGSWTKKTITVVVLGI